MSDGGGSDPGFIFVLYAFPSVHTGRRPLGAGAIRGPAGRGPWVKSLGRFKIFPLQIVFRCSA